MPRPWLILISAGWLALAGGVSAAPPLGAGNGPLADARLLQITLPAKDLEQSVAFYRDVLGLKVLFQVKGAAFLDAGGVRLRLEQGPGVPAPGAVELYFADPGLSRAKPLSDRGVRFLGPAETVQRLPAADVRLLEFTDPAGNALALMGEVPRP